MAGGPGDSRLGAAVTVDATAAATQTGACTPERLEAEAAAREAAAVPKACQASDGIAKKEDEVRALEEALAQKRARKEAEKKAHWEALVNARADAAKKEVIEATRNKVA